MAKKDDECKSYDLACYEYCGEKDEFRGYRTQYFERITKGVEPMWQTIDGMIITHYHFVQELERLFLTK